MTIAQLHKWATENGAQEFELVISEAVVVPKDKLEDDEWTIVLDLPTCALFMSKETKEIRLAVERSEELEKCFGDKLKFYPKEDNDAVAE